MTTTGSFSFKLGGLEAYTTYHFYASVCGNTVVSGGASSFTTTAALGDIQPPHQPFLPTVTR